MASASRTSVAARCIRHLTAGPSTSGPARSQLQRSPFSTTPSAPAESAADRLDRGNAPLRDDDTPSIPQRIGPSPLASLRARAPRGDLPEHRTPQQYISDALLALAAERGVAVPPFLAPRADADAPRLPRAVQALYLRPLRHPPTHGVVVADLHLHSFSVRNLEFMADFALRAAYYLGLPARGPVPLPRKTQRWTVTRDVFIFKKSKENFERVTLKRLVQIQDGDPEVVQRWLAFLRKWCWYGVGMKANVFESEGMDALERMDQPGEEALRAGMEAVDWNLVGRRSEQSGAKEAGEWMEEKGFGARGAGREKTAEA